MKVVYVLGLNSDKPIKDPLRKLLRVNEWLEITFTTVEEVVRNLAKHSKNQEPWVVIIHAFLDREKEFVTADNKWAPSRDQLRQLFDRNSDGRLVSVRLFWAVWTLLRGKAKFLITTGETRMERWAERSLETALADGRASKLYGWEQEGFNPLYLQDLADEITVWQREKGSGL